MTPVPVATVPPLEPESMLPVAEVEDVSVLQAMMVGWSEAVACRLDAVSSLRIRGCVTRTTGSAVSDVAAAIEGASIPGERTCFSLYCVTSTKSASVCQVRLHV